jgi:hypothetical protein
MHLRNYDDLLSGVARSGADPRHQAIDCPQAVVAASVDSSVYRWVVQNKGPEVLARFELRQENCYNQTAPDGWEWSYKDGFFSAWAGQPESGVQPGGTAEFTARVSSAGAVLGIRPLTLGLRSGESIVVGQSWAPVAKPGSMVALVVVAIAAISVLHVWHSGRPGRNAPCE